METLFDPYAVYHLPSGDLEACLGMLNSAAFHLFSLQDVTDATSFFSVSCMQLPLDPPLSGKVNWNAFTDSLWNGIDQYGLPKIAIIWLGAEKMKRKDPAGFKLAVSCLCDVIDDFQNESEKGTTDVRSFLIFIFDTDYRATCTEFNES